MQTEVLVVDYGMGNLKSVARAFEACGARIKLVTHPTRLEKNRVLVLPGVGAFPAAMKRLQSQGLNLWINEAVAQGAWLLGICLGMQLCLELGEELEITRGLGLLPGKVEKIPSTTLTGATRKLPHIGWGRIDWPQEQPLKQIFSGIKRGTDFYFVHSFAAVPMRKSDELAFCFYDGLRIPAVLGRDRVYGCQFHPEKSGSMGLQFLQNFLKLVKK